MCLFQTKEPHGPPNYPNIQEQIGLLRQYVTLNGDININARCCSFAADLHD